MKIERDIMELLRIDPQTHEAFFRKNDEWIPIIAIERDDLVNLVDLAATDDDVKLDECAKDLFIKDATAKSIYENVYKVLKDLADNRDEYLKQYKENFEMCKKEYGL